MFNQNDKIKNMGEDKRNLTLQTDEENACH